MENQLGELSEKILGVAPEIVDKALSRTASKVLSELRKLRNSLNEVRRCIEARKDLFTVRRAGEPLRLCYVAVDSGYTAPAIELIGGYLGIVVVVTIVYGSGCPKTTVDAKAYVELWFNEDATGMAAKYYERLEAKKLLEAKRAGELDFDVLLLDGEVAPRILPGRSGGEESLVVKLFTRFTETMDEIAELANKTDTPVVGVLKRSYARDLVNILGFHDLKLSDKAVMSLILEPGEYLVTLSDVKGSYEKLREELLKLKDEPRVKKNWLNSRLQWYSGILRSPVGQFVKLAFYRAHKTAYPVATKVEYIPSSTLQDEELFSSLIGISTGTGIPAPIDHADAFAQVTREIRQVVYQKLIAEVAKGAELDIKSLLTTVLSLMNPEKLRIVS